MSQQYAKLENNSYVTYAPVSYKNISNFNTSEELMLAEGFLPYDETPQPHTDYPDTSTQKYTVTAGRIVQSWDIVKGDARCLLVVVDKTNYGLSQVFKGRYKTETEILYEASPLNIATLSASVQAAFAASISAIMTYGKGEWTAERGVCTYHKYMGGLNIKLDIAYDPDANKEVRQSTTNFILPAASMEFWNAIFPPDPNAPADSAPTPQYPSQPTPYSSPMTPYPSPGMAQMTPPQPMLQPIA
ncbi:MAG: hypothetical protein RR382_00305 [Tannerellaceae bacterium]